MTQIQKMLSYMWDRCETNKTTGCWDWTGIHRSRRQPYGQITLKGKSYVAHRKSYEIFVGPIPEGKHVLHKCDNMKCINPRHLYIGTCLENMRDRRDRHPRGKGLNHWRSKLSVEDVNFIRNTNISQRILGRHFGVSKTTIGKVRRRECYQDVGGE